MRQPAAHEQAARPKWRTLTQVELEEYAPDLRRWLDEGHAGCKTWFSLLYETRFNKPRAFVNRAQGEVQDVNCSRRDHVVFTLLLTSGVMVLVHPICVGRKIFLPCS